MTQFYHDNNPVKVPTGGPDTTATIYINGYYTEMSYSHVGLDVMALLIFCLFLRFVDAFDGIFICFFKNSFFLIVFLSFMHMCYYL